MSGPIEWVEKPFIYEDLQTCFTIGQDPLPENQESTSYCAQLTWEIVLAPCRVLSALFLACLIPFLYLFQQRDLGLHCEVLARRCIYDLTHLIGLLKFGSDFIAPLPSFYALKAHSVYLLKPLTRDQIHDPAIPAKLLDKGSEFLEFYSREGICRGVTSLFINTYVHTQHSNPEAHMRLLASWVSQESERVALLAAFHFSDDLLKISRNPELDSGAPSIPVERDAICKEVKNLACGMYEIDLIGHKMAFLKVDNDTGYLINHMNAVLRVSPEALAECLLSYQSSCLYFFAMHERVDETAS